MSILNKLTPADHVSLLKRANQLCKALEPARDLLQDVFVKALQNEAKFQGKSSLVTWVNGFIPNVEMNRRTVEYGRGNRKGRRALLGEYSAEQIFLYRNHGRWKRPCRSK